MELVRTLLEGQPMAALFLTIALGYLVGRIHIKGFSLGAFHRAAPSLLCPHRVGECSRSQE